MAFSDNLHDLEHLIADSMGNALEAARRGLAEQIRRRSESGLRDARERGFRDLREATARLDTCRTQAEVLSALLEESGRFASRTALLLTFVDGARGWAEYGFSDHAEGIESLRLGYDNAALGRLAAGRGAVTLSAEESVALAGHLGGGEPCAGLLVPLVLHDRVAAALYADQLRPADPFVPAALQLLVYAAAHLLEAQAGRTRALTPTLAGIDVDQITSALPLWDPAAVQAASAAAAPHAAPAAEPAAAAPVSAPAAVQPVMVAPEPPAAEPAIAAAVEPEPAWHETPPEPAWQEPAPWDESTAIEALPVSAEAPAPWEEVPEEPAWAAATAPEPLEPPAPAAPAWQPTWQMEEAPAAPAVEPEAEEAWVDTDQGYEAQPEVAGETTYEGTAEEIPLDAADDTASVPMEEVSAEAVDDEQPAATSGWQTSAAPQLESPESITSPLYGAPLYPSEATMRISRDLLPNPAAPPPMPVDVSEDSTVLLQRSAMSAPAPAATLDDTQSKPATPPSRPAPVFGGGGGSSSTEVQPPPDLEGPGWAFRSGDSSTASYRQQTEENSGLHEEARRLARLLVSEIKLYNEEQIEEGRRQRDIYPRLQEDIDRSRQMYEERVDPRVRDDVDYFHQEMINILAGGDAGALGM